MYSFEIASKASSLYISVYRDEGKLGFYILGVSSPTAAAIGLQGISPFWTVQGSKMVNASPVSPCKRSKTVNLERLHPECLPAEGENGGLLGDMSPSKGLSEAVLGETQLLWAWHNEARGDAMVHAAWCKY